MYGIVLMLGATLFQETSSTLGKIKVRKREESIFSMGFLNTFFVTVFFIAIAIIRPDQFIFSFASIGTLTLKIILDIFQAHYTMLAITRSERSTFGFLRVITLPLLLVVDLFLGYSISALQLGGMMLIIIVLFFLFLNHGIRRKGAHFVLFTAFNAVITISLYKYNITHFNSVVAEQSITMFFLLLYFLVKARYITKEHPLRLLLHPPYLFQSMVAGAGMMLGSFAFLFAPASIILAVKRSSVILWSMVAGNVFFHEKKAFIKFTAGAFLILAVIFLAI